MHRILLVPWVLILCVGIAPSEAAARHSFARSLRQQQPQTAAGGLLATPAAPQDPPAVWDTISASPAHKTLADLIKANDLVAALGKPGLTVFAPTDEAFAPLVAALPAGFIKDGGLVKAILTQHVVPQLLANTTVGASYETLNSGNPVTRVAWPAETKPGSLYFTGGQNKTVSSPSSFINSNGAVYVTTAVLMPSNAFASVEDAASFYKLSILADLVTKQKLLPALNAVTPQKTVLAPVNQAFTAITSTLAGLSAAQMNQVLRYHVSPVLYTVPFTSGAIQTLLPDQRLTLVAPKSIKDGTSSSAGVIVQNVWYPGGVIQAIDKVLLPMGSSAAAAASTATTSNGIILRGPSPAAGPTTPGVTTTFTRVVPVTTRVVPVTTQVIPVTTTTVVTYPTAITTTRVYPAVPVASQAIVYYPVTRPVAPVHYTSGH